MPKVFGSSPSARNGHASILYGSSLYIFGGASNKGFLNDLHVLNLDNVIINLKKYFFREFGNKLDWKVQFLNQELIIREFWIMMEEL